jgi:hypothetical protein
MEHPKGRYRSCSPPRPAHRLLSPAAQRLGPCAGQADSLARGSIEPGQEGHHRPSQPHHVPILGCSFVRVNTSGLLTLLGERQEADGLRILPSHSFSIQVVSGCSSVLDAQVSESLTRPLSPQVGCLSRLFEFGFNRSPDAENSNFLSMAQSIPT